MPKATPVIHRWRSDERHCLDVKLYHTRTTVDIFWSERGNSYVLAAPVAGAFKYSLFKTADGKLCVLTSINGIGEVRWTADTLYCKTPSYYPGSDGEEQAKAITHFGLRPAFEG